MNDTACPNCSAPADEVRKNVHGYDLVRCRRCTLTFIPSAQLTAVAYDDLYQADSHYSAHVREAGGLREGKRPRFSRARRRALDTIKELQPDTLLEVGCGVGNFLAWVEHLGIRCSGLDVSEEAISLARSYLDCPLHVGALSPSVFAGRTFQVVCAWEVLEHVSDPAEFLQRLRERLTEDGILFMSTPNYESTWMWNDVHADPRGVPPVHVTFWNRKALTDALRRHGFEVISIQRYSIPKKPAVRSGGRLSRYAVVPDAVLRRSQRRTILVQAERAH